MNAFEILFYAVLGAVIALVMQDAKRWEKIGTVVLIVFLVNLAPYAFP